VLLAILGVFHSSVQGQPVGNGPPKRLIEFGWDCPTPAFIARYIDRMQERPFDGVAFRLRGRPRPVTADSGLPVLHGPEGLFDLQGGSRALQPVAFEERDFEAEYRLLAGIDWGRFTDNFVVLYAASDQDWFNDTHWDAIETNVRLVARAARIGRCAGILFDPEPYGPSPWDYGKVRARREASFAEYRRVVRRRGARFLRTIEDEYPETQILTLFMMTALMDMSGPMPADERAAQVQDDRYALLPAFLEGMLDAAGPTTRIHDGNEGAYYYDRREEYFESYHAIRERGRALVAPELGLQYEQSVRAAQALYLDEYLGLRPGGVRREATYMTPEERLKWVEHNAFWALFTADRYVWCYNERVVWWDFEGIDAAKLAEMGMGWVEHEPVPEGCEAALRAARTHQAVGTWPAIDLGPIMDRVEGRRRLY
jgi:hypothetical protein